MLKARDLRGVFGILPTPAKDGADAWDAVDTVDLVETERLINQVIDDGVDGIMALGTMGECATLTDKEFDGFVDCVLSTVRRRVPTFIGTTALGQHEVVRRMKFVRDRGADGTLLGLPMWQPCTLEMALEYYGSLSKGFPDLALMVYANARAFRFDFPVAFWEQIMKHAPTVCAAKFSDFKNYAAVVAATGGNVNFMPTAGRAAAYAKVLPDVFNACWVPAYGPQPAVAMMDAILSKDWARMEEVEKDFHWASAPARKYVTDPEIFASFNIQIEKLQMNASGYVKAGPVRPPYHIVPQDIKDACQESGRRFGELRAKYASAGSPVAHAKTA
jgi:trans-o-hydroxybenzylidenepyruvate hydratase-aldolase